MTKIVSVVYCDAEDCPGHRTERDYPGKRLVMTDNPARPFALEDED